MSAWWALWWACGAPEPPQYTVRATVVEVRSDRVVVLDHEPIDGFMDAMVMPFEVRDPALLNGLRPADQVEGTYVVEPDAAYLSALRVTAPAPRAAPPTPPHPRADRAVPVGEVFPTTPVLLASGSTLTLGAGQDTGGRVALTFLYTRCPVPQYCPLVVSRFQALQAQLPARARLIALTIDPDHDSPAVLRDFAETSGAEPGRWDFGRVPREVLIGVAEKAGLSVHGRGLELVHDLVLVVLDTEGRVVARYDHFDWPLAELVTHLGG